MIVLYQGRRGCGKTTSLIKDAWQLKQEGWDVVTNMTSVSFADKVLDNKGILSLLETDYTDFVIVIDEIQTFIDSRRSARGQNVTFSYFIQQVRKRNIIILAATQFSRRVDRAFREHVDILAKPEFYPEFPVVRVVYWDLTVYEDGFDDPDREMSATVVFDPRPVFALFDTTEVIKPGLSRTNPSK